MACWHSAGTIAPASPRRACTTRRPSARPLLRRSTSRCRSSTCAAARRSASLPQERPAPRSSSERRAAIAHGQVTERFDVTPPASNSASRSRSRCRAAATSSPATASTLRSAPRRPSRTAYRSCSPMWAACRSAASPASTPPVPVCAARCSSSAIASNCACLRPSSMPPSTRSCSTRWSARSSSPA
jgi:hypothetical protein